jgi:hypothetical protein
MNRNNISFIVHITPGNSFQLRGVYLSTVVPNGIYGVPLELRFPR